MSAKVPSERFTGAMLALACGDALGAPAEFIRTREEMRRRFFSADARKYLGEPVEGGRSDAEDFENRTQKLTEIALVMTHGILKSIPHVGHPDFRDA